MSDSTPSGRVIIAGGSGFLGTNLAHRLTELGCDVVVLTRSQARTDRPWRCAQWDARTFGDWAEHLDGASALVNLVGRSVDCVKTPDHCDEILRSRVEATRALGEAVRRASDPPRVWAQMSTAHIYGDPPEATIQEGAAFGYGLAPTVGVAWERAFDEAAPEGVRGLVLRTSFVLGRTGGALPRLAKLARWGLGGRVGRGRQWMSWIHERDMNRLFERALTDESMRGAYIATAPNPVSNEAFMRALRRAVRRRVGLPAAAWMVRAGAPLVMRTDPELALYGRRCVPRRLLDEGFTFEFPDLAPALENLFSASGRR